MLVDFAPIQEADRLLVDSRDFMTQAQQTVFSLPLVNRAGMKSWRTRRRDMRLLAIYQDLFPKVVSTERRLRSILGEVVEKKAVLRLQAGHLHARLEACIAYNQARLQDTEEPVEELRAVISTLSSESSALKDMIEFNKEVLRWANMERVSRGQTVMRWGTGRPGDRSSTRGGGRDKSQKLSEEELMKDDMHPDIETRLIVLRKVSVSIFSSGCCYAPTPGAIAHTLFHQGSFYTSHSI